MSLEIGLLRGSGDAPGNDNLPQYFRLSAAEKISLEVVRDLCAMANDPQSFYRSVSTEQWVRTVVSLDGLNRFRSNVVPRDAYLDSGICLYPLGCRGFSSVIDIERENPIPNCSSCALAQQMMHECGADRQMVDADQTKEWLPIDDRVDVGEKLYRNVHKIAWRSGTFVRKRFKFREIFDGELEVATAVSHPNLVHYFGFSLLGSDRSFSESRHKGPDLFMECLDKDLQTFLQEAEEEDTSFPFHERLNVLLQVAKAMKHLHDSGFVHGDLKSQNVFLSRVKLAHSEVQCYLVKVGDFGCTKRVDAPFCADIGTTNYTAPEVLHRRYRRPPPLPPLDPKMIDVFSFGVVAYQVLTGAVNLYEGCEYPRHIVNAVIEGIRPDSEGQGANLDGLSLSMRTLVKRCWAENLEERPSFSQICDELNTCSKEDGLCSNLENPEERPSFSQICDELNRCSKEHGLCGNLENPEEQPSFSQICDELNRCSEEHGLRGNLENPEEQPSFSQICDELNRCSEEHGLRGNLAKLKQRLHTCWR